MNICGIVCEYNPFHNGHRYLIDVCRRKLGADSAVVCVMSGDFVQRGEAAVYCKHDRARAAVAGGADLVIELPLPWSLAPAERFARGAVGLLGATGCVTHLVFGSESGDLAALRETAALLLEPETDALLRAELESGISYAAARQKAVEARSGKAAIALTQPNDILAVEYLKALALQGLDITPLAVRRCGAGHDERSGDAFPSAAMLREKLRAGETLRPWMPEAAFAALENGAGPLDAALIGTALLSRLRFLPEAAFAALPDVSEGLENRLSRAARTAPTMEALEDAASSKRYPRARVRRLCVSAALGVRAADGEGIPPYLRVLAANRTGLSLLREMERGASLPLLTKPAHAHALGAAAERVFSLGAAAADLCALGFTDPSMREGDRDWRSSPAILD